MRAPLGPNFTRLWSAAVVSSVGSGVTLAALPLYAAAEGGRSAVAIVAAAEAASGLLLALPSGVLADRLDRRALMVRADVWRFVALLAAVGVIGAHVSAVAALAVLAAFLGAGEAVFRAASRAVVPAIVDTNRLDGANGRLIAAEDLCLTLIGPPLGALLFAFGRQTPLLFDAASYVASAALLSRLAPGLRIAGERGRLRDARDVVAHNRPLRFLVLATFVCAICGALAFTLLVLAARENVHTGATGFGLLVSVLAVGGVVGSLAVEHLPFDRRSILGSAVILNAAAYAAFAAASSWVTAVPPLLLWGGSVSAGMVASLTMRQKLAPERSHGSVFAMFQLTASAGSVLGAVGAGLLAVIGGLRFPYLVVAVLQAVVGIVVWVALVAEPVPAPA